MDCGWIVICILSNFILKSHNASTNSSALFIIVAESIDIFAPMSQLGCFRASFGVIESNSLIGFLRKGPPLPVRMIFFNSF